MLYLLMFIFSLTLLSIGSFFRKKNKYVTYFVEILSLSLPCIMAGLRDFTIGTDTDVYVINLFKTALKDSEGFLHYYFHPYSNVSEPLYLFVTYICSKISSNIGILFFVNEMLVIFPIFVALKKLNKDNYNGVILGMFIYYLFFYNMSLNIARQSIAISFSVLAFAYLEESKKIKTIMFTIVAFLFHRTAIILIPIYLLYYLFECEKIKDKTKNIIKISLAILIGTGIIFFKQLLEMLIQIGIYSKYFSMILDKFVRNPIDFNQFNIVIYCMIFLIIYKNSKIFLKQINNFEFYKYISFLSIIVLQVGGIIKFSDRIGYYIIFPTIFILLPRLAPKKFEELHDKDTIINMSAIIGTFFIYWFFWIIIQNVHETNPYLIRSVNLHF